MGAEILERGELLIVAVILIARVPAELLVDADRQARLGGFESQGEGLGGSERDRQANAGEAATDAQPAVTTVVGQIASAGVAVDRPSPTSCMWL